MRKSKYPPIKETWPYALVVCIVYGAYLIFFE